MPIRVDRALCEGNAVCIAVAPDIFDLDQDGIATVIRDDPDGEFADDVERSIGSCPRLAISVV